MSFSKCDGFDRKKKIVKNLLNAIWKSLSVPVDRLYDFSNSIILRNFLSFFPVLKSIKMCNQLIVNKYSLIQNRTEKDKKTTPLWFVTFRNLELVNYTMKISFGFLFPIYIQLRVIQVGTYFYCWNFRYVYALLNRGNILASKSESL